MVLRLPELLLGTLLEEGDELALGGPGKIGDRSDDVAIEETDVSEPAEDLLE